MFLSVLFHGGSHGGEKTKKSSRKSTFEAPYFIFFHSFIQRLKVGLSTKMWKYKVLFIVFFHELEQEQGGAYEYM